MKKTSKDRSGATAKTSVPASTWVRPPVEAVSRRAREIWMARGQPMGCDEEIWYEAERQVAAEVRQGMPPLEDRGIPVAGNQPLESRVDEMLAHHTTPRRATPTQLPP
jgi:hypothetical protein